jgi:hypothetical protein
MLKKNKKGNSRLKYVFLLFSNVEQISQGFCGKISLLQPSLRFLFIVVFFCLSFVYYVFIIFSAVFKHFSFFLQYD